MNEQHPEDLSFESMFDSNPMLGALRALYDHAPCCGKIIDDEARLVSMSTLGQVMMEVDDFSAIRGIDWLSVWVGEDHQKACDAFEKAKETGYGSFDGFAYTVKGTPKWWHVQIIKIPHETKGLFFALSEDVTAKVELAKLQGMEGQVPSGRGWRVNTGQGVLDLHVDGTVAFADDVVSSWLHLEDHTQGVVFKSFGESFQLMWQNFVEDESLSESVMNNVLYASGPNTWKQFDIQLLKIPSLSQDTPIVRCVLVDTSARMKLQHELEQLYNLSPNLIMISNGDGLIEKLNPAWTKLFGEVEVASLIGKSFIDYVHPDDVKPTIKELERILGGGENLFFVNRYMSPSRGPVWLGWSAALSSDGSQVFGVAIDISSQKALESAMRQANMTLVHYKEQLELFTHIASHDLQEPLRKQRIFFDLVRHSLGEDATERQLRHISRGERSAARMSHVIEGMLELSKVSQENLDLAEHAVLDILNEALERVSLMEALSCTISCSPSIQVYGMRSHLVLLFAQLLENASIFVDEERPSKVDILVKTQVEFVQIDVSDNGIGIDSKYAIKIFEPLQRVSSQSKGIGIGLALCKKIVNRHDGSISVADSESGGSKFTICLPSKEPPE